MGPGRTCNMVVWLNCFLQVAGFGLAIVRSLPPRNSRREDLPATYIGTMPGFQNLPAIDHYNLHAPVGVHPVGSTVSGTTLEKHGFRVPATTASERQGDDDMSEVELRTFEVA